MEGSEMRQVDPVVKDQRGLDAAVGEEQAARQLRQVLSVLAHDRLQILCLLALLDADAGERIPDNQWSSPITNAFLALLQSVLACNGRRGALRLGVAWPGLYL